MKKLILLVLLVAALASTAALPARAQSTPVEVRITWYNDGNEGEVLRDLLNRFEQANSDIKVVVDTVAYKVILEQLPAQVQANQGPDIARITNWTGFVGKYLDLRPLVKDAKYWEDNFPANLLASMRKPDDKTGIYGFPTQFTVTGPFINRTLFEQAKVEVPSDKKKDVTWEEWTEAAAKVAKATNTQYAIAMDRTGHRFAGPAISLGANYFDKDGKITIDSPGYRTMAELLIKWHKDKITPAEVWVGSGSSYAAADNFFANGQLVMYMSGSWQVQNFTNKVKDTFDWEAIPNPTGKGGSTGMPGGAGLVAFASTKNPKQVARVMDYLASEPVLREFTERTLFIPGHLGMIKSGVTFKTDSKLAQKSLTTFLNEIPKLQDQAYKLQFHPQNSVIFNETRDRLTQVITGELTLDEAIKRIQAAVDKAVAEAK
jgi:alpha-1,4-digalacturonate transport system substrate-binding protein